MGRRKTQEEFIELAVKVHGAKYDYSITQYKDWKSKIKYICPSHGVQSQTAQPHLSGYGCKKCGREKTRQAFNYDTAKFVDLANKKHGNRYSYPNAVYTNYHGKVRIECRVHGEFIQGAGLHIHGNGCQKCGQLKGSNKCGQLRGSTSPQLKDSIAPLIKPENCEDFIRLSTEVHRGQYDYSLVGYKNHYTTVTVVCLDHGPFKCMPTLHLKGNGCTLCQNFNSFVEKARSLYGDKFDYDKSTYVNNKSKVRITCRSHGDFWILPGELTRQRADTGIQPRCPVCHFESRRLSLEEVIKKSKKIHGSAYGYDKLILGQTLKERAIFYCIKCLAYFTQKPSDHLRGSGCPKCCESKHERLITLWLQTTEYKFESQKIFPDLRYKLPLKCDFYIEKLNLIIEFDGIQHFEPVDAWGGVEKFPIAQARDLQKNNYCTEKRINLLRIKDGQNAVLEIKKIIGMIENDTKQLTIHLIYGDMKIF